MNAWWTLEPPSGLKRLHVECTEHYPPPPPKSLSLHCKEIKIVKSKVDGQLSSHLTCLQVFDYEAAFTQMHFVFLELGAHCLLDFKLLTANKKLITVKTIHLQLLNNDYIQ